MRAAILQTPGEPFVIADDVDIEDPRAGEVRVRVSHCGVCHSDLSMVNGSFPGLTPVILGHEAAGTVDAVGPGVTALAPGDKVVLTPTPSCGECYWCVRDEHSLCANSSAIVLSAFPDGSTRLSRRGETVYRGVGVGAFAEFVITQVSGVIGCAMQTGVGAVLNTAGVAPGDTVLVAGLGGIGLAAVQGARIAGATTIIASDPVPERRDHARRLGATEVIDPATEDLVAAVMARTGVGVDHAFECAGRASLISTLLDACRGGGTTTCVGAPALDEAIVIDPAVMFTASGKRLLGCLLGSVNSRREIPRLLDLWRRGLLDLESMITNRGTLEDIDAAFADLAAGRGVRTVLAL
jgi:Zn-dependent alcohol dehydrogenase